MIKWALLFKDSMSGTEERVKLLDAHTNCKCMHTSKNQALPAMSAPLFTARDFCGLDAYSPFLKKVCRYLLQETGRTLNLIVKRTAQPKGRKREIKFVLGSSDRDIK